MLLFIVVNFTNSFLQHCQVADPDITSDTGFDVLDEHYKKNGIPHPPNHQAAAQDTESGSELSDGKSMASDDNNDNNGDDTNPHTMQHSKKPYGMSCTDPAQLHFYPSNWAEVLTTAKGYWHLILGMVFAFLKCCLHKDEL